MTRGVLATCGALLLSCSSEVLAGPEIVEGPGDAGSLPPTAQPSSFQGTIGRIVGELSGGLGGVAGNAPADLVDMYRIYIAQPELFRIDFSDASMDVSLWLFDSSGRGVLANRDSAKGSFGGPLITGMTTDGGLGIFNIPGFYYLAISGDQHQPIANGGAMFLFDAKHPFEVSAADGPGGRDTITGWEGPGVTGAYDITIISGVMGEPAPGPASLSVLAAGALAGLRRRRRIGA